MSGNHKGPGQELEIKAEKHEDDKGLKRGGKLQVLGKVDRE